MPGRNQQAAFLHHTQVSRNGGLRKLCLFLNVAGTNPIIKMFHRFVRREVLFRLPEPVQNLQANRIGERFTNVYDIEIIHITNISINLDM